MKHENVILQGIIIVLALTTVIGTAAAAVAGDKIADLQYELASAQADAATYQEGYYATLARVEELEWQLETMNGGGVGE